MQTIPPQSGPTEPHGEKPSREQYRHEKIHNDLMRINRKAIFVLLSIVIGQFLVSHHIVDAGEMTMEGLLECTNAIRTRSTDNELILNDQLNEAALEKLKDMQEYKYWAHENPSTSKKPWDFVDQAGYYYQTTGENLAIGFMTSQEICDAWEASETHLANIENKTFQEVGFAINKANLHEHGKGILVVQMFGSRDDFEKSSSLETAAPEDCLTTQGCEKVGIQKEVLGAQAERKNPVIDFISKNILIFVIISSYFIVRFLLTLFVGKKHKYSKKGKL